MICSKRVNSLTFCGTTKETLRHYKDIGLLMPVAKAENGYQLYSPAADQRLPAHFVVATSGV